MSSYWEDYNRAASGLAPTSHTHGSLAGQQEYARRQQNMMSGDYGDVDMTPLVRLAGWLLGLGFVVAVAGLVLGLAATVVVAMLVGAAVLFVNYAIAVPILTDWNTPWGLWMSCLAGVAGVSGLCYWAPHMVTADWFPLHAVGALQPLGSMTIAGLELRALAWWEWLLYANGMVALATAVASLVNADTPQAVLTRIVVTAAACGTFALFVPGAAPLSWTLAVVPMMLMLAGFELLNAYLVYDFDILIFKETCTGRAEDAALTAEVAARFHSQGILIWLFVLFFGFVVGTTAAILAGSVLHLLAGMAGAVIIAAAIVMLRRGDRRGKPPNWLERRREAKANREFMKKFAEYRRRENV